MYNSNTQNIQGGISHWPRRGADWLDARGRGAWIAAMVLGFIFVWPLGLGILVYMIVTKRFCKRSHKLHAMRAGWCNGSSGNSAFDAYRDDTIRRLEQEQAAFEAFLKRLRDAKDKQEFDSFMEDRNAAEMSREPHVDAADEGIDEAQKRAKDIAAY